MNNFLKKHLFLNFFIYGIVTVLLISAFLGPNFVREIKITLFNSLFFIVVILISIKGLITFSEYSKKKKSLKKIIKLKEKKDPSSELSTSLGTNFNVINFNGIKKIEVNLPFEKSWIFFTGYNGFGKTNILQAIARGLSSFSDNNIYNAINPISDNTEININIFGLEKKYSLSKDKIDLNKSKYRIMGYGASRLDMGSEKSTKVSASCSSLFETQVLLRNIEEEGLSRWYFKDKEKYKFYNTEEIFKKLIPNLAQIFVDEDDNKILYIEEDEEGNLLAPVYFHELATGYQNIISMVGNIILNITDNSKKYETNKINENQRHIVLIDELELYLHPSLQKKLPLLLSEIFPNILFISTTHSPLTLLGAPKESAFFITNRSAEEGITIERIDERIYIDELLPNSILTSPLFKMTDIFPTSFTGEKQISVEDYYNDIEINSIIRRKIKTYITDEKEENLVLRYKNRIKDKK